MERIPSPKDLRGAAAVAQSLAYAVGLAGVVAGGLLLRQETAFAVIVWVLTFAAGAILMIAAFLTRAIAVLLGRVARIESDVSVLVAEAGRAGEREPQRDPWRHHPQG